MCDIVEYLWLSVDVMVVVVDVVCVVVVGVVEVYVYLKDVVGCDSFVFDDVVWWLWVVWEVCFDVLVGVIMGVWVELDVVWCFVVIEVWEELFDFVFVNWYEVGVDDVVVVLLW